jgi:hypothetical protein
MEKPRRDPLQAWTAFITERLAPPSPSLDLERQQLRHRLSRKESEAVNAWDTHRALMLDLLKAAEGHDAPLVRALEPRVEHTRHIHAVALEACRELRQQIDTITAEELTRASLRASQHVSYATWVLAGATIVLAIATVALIFVTWKA